MQNAESPEQAQDGGKVSEIPAIERLQHTVKVLRSGGDTGSEGFSEPHFQLSSQAGIIATTPASAIFYGGNTCCMTAGNDINFAAQGNYNHLVTKGVSLFTYGKADSADKPIQETGIRLHAASGKVSVQSQGDATRLIADKTVTVASVTKSVNIQALEHVLLTALGAFIKLEGGNIELCAPGKIEFKAGMKEFTGPKAADEPPAESPKSSVKGCAQATADASGSQAGAQRL
jgi:type VI secretion system secreted protein VgrG